MNLKEATAEKHSIAENTPFMKAVFQHKITKELWADYTYQRSLIYNGIESMAKYAGLLEDLADLPRAHNLYLDWKDMTPDPKISSYKNTTIEYYKYILNLHQNPDKIMAHLYVWHMGDLYGGQAIKKLAPGPHRSLEFNNVEELKQKIRSKLNDDMADEANIAFDWAIKLLNEYDVGNLG